MGDGEHHKLQREEKILRKIRHSLSQQQMEYYRRVTDVIRIATSDPQTRATVLASVRAHSLAPLAPYLVQFFYEIVIVNLQNLAVLSNAVALLRALHSNRTVPLQMYLHNIIEPLLTCIIGVSPVRRTRTPRPAARARSGPKEIPRRSHSPGPCTSRSLCHKLAIWGVASDLWVFVVPLRGAHAPCTTTSPRRRETKFQVPAPKVMPAGGSVPKLGHRHCGIMPRRACAERAAHAPPSWPACGQAPPPLSNMRQQAQPAANL